MKPYLTVDWSTGGVTPEAVEHDTIDAAMEYMREHPKMELYAHMPTERIQDVKLVDVGSIMDVARRVDEVTKRIAERGENLNLTTGHRKTNGVKKAPRRTKAIASKKIVRDMTCIAPRCKERSKGPRYHYLCDGHVKVPRSVWKKWQKKRQKAAETR